MIYNRDKEKITWINLHRLIMYSESLAWCFAPLLACGVDNGLSIRLRYLGCNRPVLGHYLCPGRIERLAIVDRLLGGFPAGHGGHEYGKCVRLGDVT